MRRTALVASLALGLSGALAPGGAGAANILQPTPAREVGGVGVLTHREQAPLIRGWIQARFRTVLP
ncbi:MAG: hypothetical protein IMZ44_02780, partial [Planctomycetes bacterium]|nr:hypothetical protein [Planctomycetota bacterium]